MEELEESLNFALKLEVPRVLIQVRKLLSNSNYIKAADC
jgi:hypothetical protein